MVTRLGRRTPRAALLFLVVGLAMASAERAAAQERGRQRPQPRPTPSVRAAPGRQTIPVGYVNLSELQYRPHRNVTRVLEEPEAEAPARRGRPTLDVRAARTTGVPAVRWTTAAGRRALGDRLQLIDVVATRGVARAVGRVTAQDPLIAETICVAPTLTKAGSGCCRYTIRDELAGADVTYRQPLHVFGTEEAARDFAATVRASMPMFVPYRDPAVYAGGGWLYDGGSFHGAVDYGKTADAYGEGIDPAFRVYAIAPGRVVSVVFDGWSGNIVVIEHTAPNGDRYRSAYKHMRNGFSSDLASARMLPVAADEMYKADGVTPTNRLKYQRFANLEDPSELHWGTEAQTIAVEVGDWVQSGQFLGWSGNTGPGGAGNGLNNDGTPADPNTANNHLHFMLAVPDPTPGSTDWVQVDPYGVYSTVGGSACYDLLDNPAYVRLFAPFYPAFHNVPAEYIGHYWGYYAGMGMGLQTLSLHRDGNRVLASGAFQTGLSGDWYARMFMTGDEFQQWFETYDGQGYRPREIAVTMDGDGAPRFTVIWKKRDGEGYVAHSGLSDADWEAKWQEYVEDGPYRVEDRTAYEAGGARSWVAVFVADGDKAFAEYHYMSSDTFNARAERLGDDGFIIWSVDPEELSGGTRFGAIWRRQPGSWVARHGLSPAEYQSEFEKWSGEGYRLHRVRGYADSERFAAVWVKP